jgi:hypothetical protein
VTRTALLGTVTPMKGGWLEHEIRSLPQVLACSITKDDVVVLIQPSADPVSVERSVQELLRRSGVDRPVRVFGGARPLFVEPVKVRRGAPALVGTVGGALVLAAGVWLAGATTGLRGGAKTRVTAAALAPPVAHAVVTLPVVGGGGTTAPNPEKPLPPLLRPSSSPIFGTRRPGGGTSPAPHEPSLTPRAPRVEAASCTMPHEGVPLKPKNGGGYGPPVWSHSIHVAAHCAGSPR